jgi:hypothetical protein
MELKGLVAKMMVAGMVGSLGFFSFNSDSYAGGTQATIQVTATVLPRISQTLVRQAGFFQITKENAKEGYVDVPAATVLQVKTNSRNGYFLTFEFNPETATEVWVMDGQKTTVLSTGMSMIPQAIQALSDTKEISYRLFIHPDTQPGQYAWPVNVFASLI